MSRPAAPKANSEALLREGYPMSAARPPEGARTAARSAEVSE
ncbi:hypothetical protein SAMN05444680_105194 [Variovorax sp. YR216]|nr:hypothetical protein SAMN05444680_105194 [Variovorax sp. YR216]